ncbi:MAG TPA: condensation domain-containing protein, partial [Blastocatellia bacterium]|nr:condensation domain-containing protein [Blastocatellia bacterium]
MSDTIRFRVDTPPEKRDRLIRKLERLSKKATPSFSIQPVGRDAGFLPLSFEQERLWFLDQLQPDTHFYIISKITPLGEAINAVAFHSAITEVVRRHEVLRTVFVTGDNGPRQVIHGPRTVDFPQVDLTALAPNDCRIVAAEMLAKEGQRPFVLKTAPLFRSLFIRATSSQSLSVLTSHHIITDAWSSAILDRELTGLYRSYSSGQPSPLAEILLQYADYAVWQRRQFQGEFLDRQVRYWRSQLENAPTVLTLPADKARPSMQRHAGAMESFGISRDVTASLRSLNQAESVTLFMTLLCGFGVLLYRYSNERDIVIGTPTAGRNSLELEALVGFFVNTLVLRLTMGSETVVSDFIKQVRDVALGAYAHQDIPFEKLVEELKVERSL